jgi:hypothetical protein
MGRGLFFSPIGAGELNRLDGNPQAVDSLCTERRTGMNFALAFRACFADEDDMRKAAG